MDTSRILTLDLGRFNSVLCWFGGRHPLVGLVTAPGRRAATPLGLVTTTNGAKLL